MRNPLLDLSRRHFVGGVTSALGLLTLKPGSAVPQEVVRTTRVPVNADEYDSLAKLANNENPYGPPESVMKAMTNAFKYAYPDRAGEVRVRLKRLADGRAELVVEDDGIGRSADGVAKGSGLGTRIVSAMARTIGAEVEYIARHPGTGARVAFPSPAKIG